MYNPFGTRSQLCVGKIRQCITRVNWREKRSRACRHNNRLLPGLGQSTRLRRAMNEKLRQVMPGLSNGSAGLGLTNQQKPLRLSECTERRAGRLRTQPVEVDPRSKIRPVKLDLVNSREGIIADKRQRPHIVIERKPGPPLTPACSVVCRKKRRAGGRSSEIGAVECQACNIQFGQSRVDRYPCHPAVHRTEYAVVWSGKYHPAFCCSSRLFTGNM